MSDQPDLWAGLPPKPAKLSPDRARTARRKSLTGAYRPTPVLETLDVRQSGLIVVTLEIGADPLDDAKDVSPQMDLPR